MEGDERKAEKGDGEGERSPILYEEADKRKQNNSQGKGGLDEEDLLKLSTNFFFVTEKGLVEIISLHRK